MVNQQYKPDVFLGILTNNDYKTYHRFKINTDETDVKQFMEEEGISNQYHPQLPESQPGIFFSLFTVPCFCEVYFKGGKTSVHSTTQKKDLELKILINFDKHQKTNKKFNHLLLRTIKEFTNYSQEEDQRIYAGLCSWEKVYNPENNLLTLSKQIFLREFENNKQKYKVEIWRDIEF